MKADVSRIRFNPGRSYTAVLQQQGRVALDADANEQCFIDAYQAQAETIDAIGQYGGPAADAGFQITAPSNVICIGPGRYYVNGLLCDNPVSLSYDEQPYLSLSAAVPDAAALLSGLNAAAGAKVIQVRLEVWQRLQTALDDPCLLEPALGLADTTARLQTVWRVVADLVQVAQPPPAPPQPSTGTMTAGTSGPAADCGCGPVAAAGYQGIENQLYRVEIHTGTAGGTQPTWKWSRENGSVVTSITAISGSTVTVSSLGLDTNLGFQPGQWVELTDDTLEFGRPPNAPGTLYQIQSINKTDLSATLAVPPNQAISVDPAQHARMRRWDQSGPAATAAGIPLSAGAWIQLENGIQVSFATGTYNSGDYWTIPARAATGQIEWPPCGSDGNGGQLPTSVQVYSAPLACLQWIPPSQGAGGAAGVLPVECRQIFSPLTAIAPPVTPKAVHVTGISWANDDVMTLDYLIANGLQITLDQAPTCPLSGANVIVTVEPAQPAAVSDSNLPLANATNLRTVTVIDTAVALDGSAISWQLPADTNLQQMLLQYLNGSLYQGAPAQQWARVRIRLPGQMIYAVGAAGPMYLDGLALGQPGVQHDGVTPRIDLRLPSGAGVIASDFDSWFYLAPILVISSLSVNYDALTVVPSNSGVTVQATVNNQLQVVSPMVTITLNYPALASWDIDLILTGTTGVGTVASIPLRQTIQAGQTSVNFPITILTSPSPGPPLTFDISATLGASTTQPTSFTVTAGAPPTHGPPAPA